jgi:hypothetical protein
MLSKIKVGSGKIFLQIRDESGGWGPYDMDGLHPDYRTPPRSSEIA